MIAAAAGLYYARIQLSDRSPRSYLRLLIKTIALFGWAPSTLDSAAPRCKPTRHLRLGGTRQLGKTLENSLRRNDGFGSCGTGCRLAGCLRSFDILEVVAMAQNGESKWCWERQPS